MKCIYRLFVLNGPKTTETLYLLFVVLLQWRMITGCETKCWKAQEAHKCNTIVLNNEHKPYYLIMSGPFQVYLFVIVLKLDNWLELLFFQKEIDRNCWPLHHAHPESAPSVDCKKGQNKNFKQNVGVLHTDTYSCVHVKLPTWAPKRWDVEEKNVSIGQQFLSTSVSVNSIFSSRALNGSHVELPFYPLHILYFYFCRSTRSALHCAWSSGVSVRITQPTVPPHLFQSRQRRSFEFITELISFFSLDLISSHYL